MVLALVWPLVVAVAWLVSFFLIIDAKKHWLNYALAFIGAGLITWQEYHLLVPSHTPAQLITALIFVTSLAVATISDLFEMLIPRFCSIWLVPIWILFSYLGFIPLVPHESIIGALLGYGIPWAIAQLFRAATGKTGMGEGDMELLAMIGAFVGPCAVTTSLYAGTLIALIVGVPYLYFVKKNIHARLPFAPALALGALISFHICLI